MPSQGKLCDLAMKQRSQARVFIVDIDGTLLNDDHQITAATREAVRQVAERGVRVVLASARSPTSLRRIMGDLGIEGWAICYTGALTCLLDPRPGAPTAVVAEQRMDIGSARMVVARALEQGISVGWFAGDDCYLPRWNPTWRRECAITGDAPIILPDLAQVTEAPHKLLCIAGEPETLPALNALAKTLPAGCVGQFSHATYLEITHTGVDKAAALVALGQRLGIGVTQMVAIGDQENDRAMLRVAAVGIAMGNAPPAVKAVADWVTETNTRDGVAVAIEWLQASGWL